LRPCTNNRAADYARRGSAWQLAAVLPGNWFMNCPLCSANIPAGSKFCEECGTPLPRACAACGHADLLKAKFCGAGRSGGTTEARGIIADDLMQAIEQDDHLCAAALHHTARLRPLPDRSTEE